MAPNKKKYFEFLGYQNRLSIKFSKTVKERVALLTVYRTGLAALSMGKRDHLGIGPLMVIIHCLFSPSILYGAGSTCIQIISLFDN